MVCRITFEVMEILCLNQAKTLSLCLIIDINTSGQLEHSASKSVIKDGVNMRVFAHEVTC